jgi:hypothetical protein
VERKAILQQPKAFSGGPNGEAAAKLPHGFRPSVAQLGNPSGIVR